VIRLGLRLTVNGGREAATRLVVLVAAVALGVGLLLIAMSGINAVNTQNARYAWLETGAQTNYQATSHNDPLWWLLSADHFGGQLIGRVDVAATGPTSPVPPGIPHLPGPGQYYASPALAALIASTAPAELAARFGGRQIGTVGDAALPAPNSLVIIVGHTAAQLAHVSGVTRATSISTVTPSQCDGSNCAVRAGVSAHGIDLVLAVVALALLFPVLIFIATATRLSAARREQRFAGMRLAGATPRQISAIAAVESVIAAVAGTAAGFGLFFAFRTPLASIPFTGAPFFPSDLSLSLADIGLVAIGVPAAAAVAARLALRRVTISPLGVTRRGTPRPPRAWRVLPLLLGVAELTWFYVAGRPTTTSGQIRAFLPGFALIMIGLIVAGPWLTMAGATVMARHTRRPAALIAARRLADDPKAGFRAVSGLVLALFITTVAVAVIGTENANHHGEIATAADTNVLLDQFGTAAPSPSSSLLARLHAIGGVLVVHVNPLGVTIPGSLAGAHGLGGDKLPAGLASCAQLATIPALGRCPAGAQVVAVPADLIIGKYVPGTHWPAVNISVQRLQHLGVREIATATNGSSRAIEQARTLLENSYPMLGPPATFGEIGSLASSLDAQYQQLADVVILVSLPIAGCALAASIAGGLSDRKRPFSLLRLTGAPLGTLRRVVGLESAVPLLVVAVAAIGLGFIAAALFTKAQLGYTLAPPQAGYYGFTLAGIVASLLIIAATMPLLSRISGPEVARNE
jgi:hypothetical protein